MAESITTLQPTASEPDLFLGSPAGLPQWLDPSKFLEKTFDPDACIADLRRFVPLSNLRNELESFLASLKTKLVEVINDDYSDFVSLSSRLVNVDGAVLRMRKPLVDLKDKLLAVQDAVKTELVAVNQGLRRRKDVAGARAMLELLQEVAHVAAKVEKLLEEVKASSSATSFDLDSRSRLLERVAGEVSRLAFLAVRGRDLAFVRNLEGRIQNAKAQLDKHLQAALRDALEHQLWSAAFHCLHACAQLNEAAPAEAAVRAALVAPVVQRVVAQHKAQHTVATKDRGFAQLLQQLLAAVEEQCRPLLEAVCKPQSGLHIFNFPANSILIEVHHALVESLPGAFSPGVPAEFHANFLAATALLDALERHCPSRGSVDAFRSSAAYTAYLKKWNLVVYFSMQFQEIAGTLEDALAVPSLTRSPSTTGRDPALLLAPTAMLWACVQQCLAPGAFLPPLADRFIKLCMQLLARFASWLAALAAARREAAAAAAAPPAAEPAPPPPPMAWVGSVGASELVVAAADAGRVAALLRGDFAPKLLAAVPGGAAEAVEAVGSALEASVAALTQQAEVLVVVVVEEVAEGCVSILKQLKGITATYRATTKAPPTRHSHYVTGVLGPLSAFLEADKAGLLPEAMRQAITQQVCQVVTSRYQHLVDDLLTSVRKTESMLHKLRVKKQRPGDADSAAASPTDSGMSDSDKICLQLFLDVREFGRLLAGFGVQAAPIPAFQKLWEAVAPADKQAIDLS